jgi:hypothetical protein
MSSRCGAFADDPQLLVARMEIETPVLLGRARSASSSAPVGASDPCPLLGLTQPTFECLLDQPVLDLGGEPGKPLRAMAISPAVRRRPAAASMSAAKLAISSAETSTPCCLAICSVCASSSVLGVAAPLRCVSVSRNCCSRRSASLAIVGLWLSASTGKPNPKRASRATSPVRRPSASRDPCRRASGWDRSCPGRRAGFLRSQSEEVDEGGQ